MTMKNVCLPNETWAKIVRRLTSEVGADDESRRGASLIKEQAQGGLTVRSTRGGASVALKARKGGDLRGVLESFSGGPPPGFEGAHFGCEDDCAPD